MTERTIANKLKEVGKHTVVYGIGSVLQALLGYILIPLYTRYYTTDIYGVLTLLLLCGNLAGTVFYLGASSALSRSYYDYENEYQRKLVVSTALCISLFGALTQVLLGFWFRDTISQNLFGTTAYSVHVVLVFASSAFTFIGSLFYVILRFERKSTQVIAVNLLSLILTTTLVVFLLVTLRLGVLAPILGTFLSQFFTLASLFYLCRKQVVFGCSRQELVLQLQYGLPQVLVALGYYTLDWLDRFLINSFGSLGDVGVYSLGYKLGIFIHTLFIIPFGQIWAPMRMEYRYDRNVDQLYRLVITYYFLFGLLLTVVISVFSKELITVIAGRQEYVIAYQVVPFVMLGHLFYGVVNIIDVGIAFERKVMYHAYVFWFCVVVNFGLNYLLIPRFGYIAAAYTTLISYVLLAGLVFVVSNRLYKIHFEGQRLIRIFGLGILALILTSLISQENLLLDVSFKTVLVSAFILCLALFVLDKKEKAKICSLLRLQLERVRI